MQTALPVELLNRLANEPDNLRRLGLDGLDLRLFYGRPGNISIGDERGVILFCHLHDGVYEGHLLMGTSLRGKKALEHARAILHWLFTLYEASAIVGNIPLDNASSRVFTRALGFARLGVSADHTGCPCVNYRLEKSAWETSSAV